MILESVACQKLVARAVDPDALRRSVPIRVRKSAFIPRANGQDNDGLSVTIVGDDTVERLRQRWGAPDKEAVTLHIGHVRQISANGHRLDVTADSIENDADHDLLSQQARCCLTA